MIATKFQWPPNLKEFYELCKSLDKSDFGPKKNVINSNHQDIKVKRIIDEGAEICKRLKIIFPECSWMKISSLFTRLKKFERLLYKELDDLGLILQLQNRDNDYFVEVLEK